jgi:hypothetical protein
MRRFPAPWTVEAIDGGFKIVDANGQALAYVATPIRVMLQSPSRSPAMKLDASPATSQSCRSYYAAKRDRMGSVEAWRYGL